MKKLKVAIEQRPENRYHARNDEDFAFLQEDLASRRCCTQRRTVRLAEIRANLCARIGKPSMVAIAIL